MNRAAKLTAAVLLIGCLNARAQLGGEEGVVVPEKPVILAQRGGKTQQAPQPPPATAYQEDLFEQLRLLNGRVDVVENQMVQLNAAHSAEKDGVSREKQAIDAKFVAYEEALRKLEAQVLALTEEMQKLKEAQTKAPEKPAKAAKADNKKTNRAWEEGEALFREKKFKEAILAYQKYRDTNPKGKFYAEATYKMGVCFQEVGLKDEAKVFFEEVISKFPGSKDAKKAAVRAKQLK